MSKWFLQVSGRIKGPYTNESMQSALAQISETQLPNAFFWKRGLTEWMRAPKWRADIAVQFAPVEQTAKTQTEIFKESPTSQNTVIPESSQSYRVQVNFVDQPVMKKTELLNFISKQKDLTKLAIQNPQTKEWSDVYGFPDIVERLGISRRKNSRVPILAQFTGTAKQTALNAKIVTISEGGMGFTEVFNLQIGDQVEGQIASPHFFQPINLVADVIYSGLDGYIGLKFTNINDEAKAAIIEYVKKFGKSQNHP